MVGMPSSTCAAQRAGVGAHMSGGPRMQWRAAAWQPRELPARVHAPPPLAGHCTPPRIPRTADNVLQTAQRPSPAPLPHQLAREALHERAPQPRALPRGVDGHVPHRGAQHAVAGGARKAQQLALRPRSCTRARAWVTACVAHGPAAGGRALACSAGTVAAHLSCDAALFERAHPDHIVPAGAGAHPT
jgi:hypothetical protein